QHDERYQPRREPYGPLCRDLRQEDPLKADFAEPEPVGQPGGDGRDEHEDEDEESDRSDDQPELARDAAAVRRARTERTDAGFAEAALEGVLVVGDLAGQWLVLSRGRLEDTRNSSRAG